MTNIIAPVPIKKGFKGNFGQKRSYEIHPGTDIGVPVGTEVKAPMDGEVKLADFNNNPKCGATIDIDYKNGFWSRFCHMSRIDVKKGDIVKQGEVVGLSGGKVNAPGAGNSKGPHLHFTLKKDGKKVDPLEYIDKTVEPGEFDVKKSEDDVEDNGSNDIKIDNGKTPDVFAKLSKKEKDELFSDVMSFIASESKKGDNKKILSETLRIKHLMK